MYLIVSVPEFTYIQYNLNGSNTDGSFTVDESNTFFNPCKVLQIPQENKYLGFFSYFIMELYVVCTHLNRFIEAILMSKLNIQSLCRKSKTLRKHAYSNILKFFSTKK